MLDRSKNKTRRGSSSSRTKSGKRTTYQRSIPERLSPSAARESHRWYRLIVDNVRDFAIFSSEINGNVSSWNPGAERFFGYDAKEILGKSMDILYTPEDIAAGVHAQEIYQALATGRAEDERWHVRKDGSRFYGSGVMMAVHDAAGNVRGCVKVLRDMTAHHLAIASARNPKIVRTENRFATQRSGK